MNKAAHMAAAASAGKDQPLLQVSTKFWLSFVISLATSFILVLFSRTSLTENMPGHSLAGDFGDFVTQVTGGWDCVLSHKCEKVPGPEPKSHAVTVSSGIVQIVGVIAITFLWFYAFVLSGWWFRAIALVPTCIYVWGMFNAYQPAVLVAALAAIFVAAEHYRSLQDQEKQLQDQEIQLLLQGKQLSASKTALDGTRNNLERVVEDVVHIKNSTQLSLNEAGQDIFTQDVYGAYSRAKTVYGVVRAHAIEEDWWRRAEQEFAHGKGLAEVWDWYETPVTVDPGTKQRLTLFSALTQERIPGEKSPGVESAYFVSYMPMPGSAEWEIEDDAAAKAAEKAAESGADKAADNATDKAADKAAQKTAEKAAAKAAEKAAKKAAAKAALFEDLLGLAWECLVLEKVRQTLPRHDSIGEWISRPRCWAHATNNEVWQVIKRRPLEESTVVKTADLHASFDNRLDKDLSNKLIESTQAEIRRYLRRGMPAEEYLCAVLCYARRQDPDGVLRVDNAKFAYSNVARGLEELHMDEWLNLKGGAISDSAHWTWTRNINEQICVAIFQEFLDLCWYKPVSSEPQIRTPSSLFLAQEVL